MLEGLTITVAVSVFFCSHQTGFRPSDLWCAWTLKPREYVQHELGNLQLHADEACIRAGDARGGGGGSYCTRDAVV